MINKIHLIIHTVLLYFIVALFLQLIVIKQAMVKMEIAQEIMSRSVMIEHETLTACEAGKLKEYRARKLEELNKALGRK